MEGDRKYRQHGYMDSGKSPVHNGTNGEPKPQHDPSAPRIPRMVETVTASRCWNCSSTLPAETDFQAACPKCAAALHCCKQCSYFDSSTRFQCSKPIPVRIAHKDERNDCELFKTRVTVARDSGAHAPPANAAARPAAAAPMPSAAPLAPKTAVEARAAFDNLFKK